MTHRITCKCEHVFDADIPELVDFDAEPAQLKALFDGSFMAVTCPSCDYVIKGEFPMVLRWPSRGISLDVLTEFDRGAFYRGERKAAADETVIGFAEAADRLLAIRDGLDPLAVETLKFYLLRKAEESAPEAEASVWYQGLEGDSLLFHLMGLRPEEVAISRVPRAIYERTLADSKAAPQEEPFASLRFKSYLSIQNLLRPEDEA